MNGPERDLDCGRVERRLAEYAADELDAAERTGVERHLAGCAACRDELSRERVLRETLAGMPLIPCPDRVSDAVLARVDLDDASDRTVVRGVRFDGRRRAVAGLVAAAAVLALLVFGPARRTGVPVPSADAAWSETEIVTARADARYGLALAASIIEKSELKTMDEVFGRRLPGAVDETLKTLTSRFEGGQG